MKAHYRLIGGVCLCASSALTSAQLASPPETMIEIRDPVGPERVVRTFSGSCGRNRFQVVLRPDRRGPGLGEVEVNGVAIVARERSKIVSQLWPGMFIMDATIVECGRREQATRARMRLVIQEPTRDARTRFLEFWLSPSRTVTGVRFN